MRSILTRLWFKLNPRPAYKAHRDGEVGESGNGLKVANLDHRAHWGFAFSASCCTDASKGEVTTRERLDVHDTA